MLTVSGESVHCRSKETQGIIIFYLACEKWLHIQNSHLDKQFLRLCDIVENILN